MIEKKHNERKEEYQSECCRKYRVSKAAVYGALGIMLFQNALPLSNVYAQEQEPATEEVAEEFEFEADPLPETSDPDEGPEENAGSAPVEQQRAPAPQTDNVIFNYTINDGKVTIDGFASTPEGWDGALVIPAQIDGKPVTGFKINAFSDNTQITSLSFEENDQLTTLAYGAFIRCSNLTNVDFRGCPALTSVGNTVFMNANLTSVDFSQNTALTSIGNHTFANTKLTSLDLSNNPALTSIGDSTFFGTKLQSIDLSNNPDLTSIGAITFGNCFDLQEVIAVENFDTVCDAFKASPRAITRTEVKILGEAAIALSLNGTIYDTVQNKAITIEALNAGRDASYAVKIPDEIQALQTGLPSGIELIWKDANGTVADLSQASSTACDASYSGEISWTDLSGIDAAAIHLIDAAAAYTGQPQPLDPAKVTYDKAGYENYPLPIENIGYKIGGAYTGNAPTDVGSYSIRLVLKAANGTVRAVELSDRYMIQDVRNLEVTGNGVQEGIDYTFDDSAKALLIHSNKQMTLKNRDITKAAEYQIILEYTHSANLIFDGINLETTKNSDGAIMLKPHGRAAITLKEGSTNSVTNLGTDGAGIKNHNGNNTSLTLQGSGSLKATGVYGSTGGWTIQSGNYEFNGQKAGIYQGQINGGTITASANGERRAAIEKGVINGGTVIATAAGANVNGIKDSTISGGMVIANTTGSMDIAINDVTVSGGNIIANAAEGVGIHIGINEMTMSGGTVTSNSSMYSSEIKGGSVKTSGHYYTTPDDGKFMDKLTHAIPAEGSDVTITNLTDAGSNPVNFNLPANHENDDKLYFYLVKEKNYEVVIEDKDAAGKETKHRLVWDWDTADWRFPAAPTIITTDLPDATTGKFYEKTLEATGDSTITWKLATGSTLPEGLSLAADTGKIAGTPTTAGDYSFSVIAENEVGASDPQTLTLTVATAVDKSVLQEKINTAEGLKESDYTSDSWTASKIEQVIETAKAVLRDSDATQDEVDNAVDALDEAMGKLVYQAKADLDKLIKDAEDNHQEADYTPDSWSNLKTALDEAENISKDPASTPDELKAAADKLQKALDDLVYKAKAELDDLIKDAGDNYEKDDYTPDSWDHLQEVLEEVKDIAEDPTSTPDELKAAEDKLQDAIDDLVKKGDTTHLQELIDEAAGLKQEDYTPDSWSMLEEAKKAAEDLITKGAASEQEVKDAEKKLQAALDGLEYQAKADLDELIKDAEKNYAEEDYTTDSWDHLQEVLKEAKEVAEDPASTPDELKAAEDKLQDAIDKLVTKALSNAEKAAINRAISLPRTSQYDGRRKGAHLNEWRLPNEFKGKVSFLYEKDGQRTAEKPLNVGDYKVIVVVEGRGEYVYSKGTIKITPRKLGMYLTALDKVYDGNTSAKINKRITNIIKGDDVNVLIQDANFSDKNAGKNKAVNYTLELVGADKDNYVIGTQPKLRATIKQKALKQSDLSYKAEDKKYDGKRNANVTTSINSGLIAGDQVELKAENAQFNNANPGKHKPVSIGRWVLTGKDAGNYSLPKLPSTLYAAITGEKPDPGKQKLTIPQRYIKLKGKDKRYDGKRNAQVEVTVTGNKLPKNVQLVAVDAQFDSANVGRNKTITVRKWKLVGKDADKYELKDIGTMYTKADITKKSGGHHPGGNKPGHGHHPGHGHYPWWHPGHWGWWH